MKKLVAFTLVLGITSGLVFARYMDNNFSAAITEKSGSRAVAVVSVEQAIEDKLADTILAAEINREVELKMEAMKREMDAEIEADLMARFDSIEWAR